MTDPVFSSDRTRRLGTLVVHAPRTDLRLGRVVEPAASAHLDHELVTEGAVEPDVDPVGVQRHGELGRAVRAAGPGAALVAGEGTQRIAAATATPAPIASAAATPKTAHRLQVNDRGRLRG